jgi:hypothetical protein
MESINNNLGIKKYIQPQIERIKLDNEISLALESLPPVPGGGWELSNDPQYFNNDPFKSNNA